MKFKKASKTESVTVTLNFTTAAPSKWKKKNWRWCGRGAIIKLFYNDE